MESLSFNWNNSEQTRMSWYPREGNLTMCVSAKGCLEVHMERNSPSPGWETPSQVNALLLDVWPVRGQHGPIPAAC
jgi:hypothetical protein